MNGGEITENSIAGGGGDGGGVYVAHGANFIMKDGTISRNTLGAKNCHGGGVFVFGIFEMNNGKIIDNSTEGAGGGVFLRGWDSDPAGSSKFIMRGGRITCLLYTSINGRGPAGCRSPLPLYKNKHMR